MGLPTMIDPDKSRSQLYEGIEYKGFWVGESQNRLNEEEHAIIRKLLPDSGQFIVDIGCGYGRLADCYLDRFKQAVMVDGSMSLLRQAQESTKGKAIYIAADVNHLPFRDSSFDCALMIRVFHHLPDSGKILAELHRILINNGIMIFNYSNKRNARQLLRWLLHPNRENPNTLEPAGLGTTLIRHHPAYVKQALNNTGFTVRKYRGSEAMEKIFGRMGRLNKWLTSSEGVSAFWGAIRLAPWIICQTVVSGKSTVNMNSRLEEILACPLCRHDLQRQSHAYACVSCQKAYPIEDDIIDFRIC